MSRARPRGEIARLETAIMALACSPDGTRLAAACWDRTVRIWDPVTGREQAVLRGHEGPVECVAFSPDGRWLASGGQDQARCGSGTSRPSGRRSSSAGTERPSCRWRSFPMESGWPPGAMRAWSRSGT